MTYQKNADDLIGGLIDGAEYKIKSLNTSSGTVTLVPGTTAESDINITAAVNIEDASRRR